MGKAVKDSSTLDFETREFVALGISIGIRCEPCISLHVEALIKAGATREELGDAPRQRLLTNAFRRLIPFVPAA